MKSASKSRSPQAARRPPEPARRADIEAWMAEQMPALQPVVREVDASIRRAIAGLQYAVKWKKAYYGLPDRGWIIELVAYDVSVNVVFFAGAEFEPPPPLGDTGTSRYAKLKTLEEVRDAPIRSWVEQAARAPGWT